MYNKMTRANAWKQWVGSLALIFCCVHNAQGEEIRDYYSEPGLNPFKDALNQSLNEHIDPFSGTLQLKYTDISVPGNGGMDININRVYVSLQETSLPLLGINGVGWTMHFGRIVTPQRNADKICSQRLFAVSTNDNPSLELPDGGRELLVLNSISNDGSLITRSNWKAQCVAGQSGMLVTSPDGTKYTMSHGTSLQGEPSWMTTRIEDVHGNWIRIDYATNAAGISYITAIYRSEEGAGSPSLLTNTKIKMTRASSCPRFRRTASAGSTSTSRFRVISTIIINNSSPSSARTGAAGSTHTTPRRRIQTRMMA